MRRAVENALERVRNACMLASKTSAVTLIYTAFENV